MFRVFRCDHCKNIITFLEDKGVPVMCCGQKMTELVANTVDAAKEKHVPQVTKNGNVLTVCVGEVEHPMLEEHHISFVALETSQGVQIKTTYPGEKPVATFALAEGETFVAAYEYCNLHGLWKTETIQG